MVNYGSLYRPRHQLNKASSTTSRPSDPSVTTPSATKAQDAQQWAQANVGDTSVTPDAYLNFSNEQQDALLDDARANAAALLVDAVADADKWQFVTARGPLNVYELRADSMDRVSSMTPADQTQLPHHMHTMLATTRVRATLDDFMRLMASAQRDTFQNVQAALFEERVQLADVFTSFGSLDSGRPAGGTSTSSTSPPSSSDLLEQYAVKYVSIQGRAPRTNADASMSARAASNSLKFGGKNRHYERQVARHSKSKGPHESTSAEELGLTMCLAEYATIRRAHLRGPMVHHLAQDFADQRIGIISHHSIEDPAITRYCRPIVPSSSRPLVATWSAAPFAMTARALVQFSGIVAYPVASSGANDKLLEVLIKFSCYDGRGVTTTRRMNMLSYLTAFEHLSTALLVLRLRESPYLTSANWVQARKSCCVCDTKFSMARRRHHCRLCGDVACSKCSAIQQIKVGKAGKCPFRICAKCDDRIDETRQRPSGGLYVQGAAKPPPKRASHSIQAIRRRLESGSTSSRHPEDDDEYSRTPSMNSSHRDSSVDQYDARSILASTNSDQTLSSMSGSTVSSLNSSRGLGAFGKSSSSKTLSISGSSLGGSFYNAPSNATTASSSRGSRGESESDHDVERNDHEDRDMEAFAKGCREDENEGDEDTAIDAIEVASLSSSSASSSRSSVVLESEAFYKRFSELSLMEFHDSEFDLSLTGNLAARLTRKSVYDFDDSEADADSDRARNLDGIGENDTKEREEGEGDRCDLFALTVQDDEDGMEFHDSNVGLEFQLQDLDLQEYQGLDELEEGDFEDEVLEEIHSERVLLAQSRGVVQASVDDARAARLAEYGIMESGKEHIYDLVAKQAAQHSKCLLATISFVDARREFIKSSFGLERAWTKVPLAHSLTAEIMRRFSTSIALGDGHADCEAPFAATDDLVTVLDARDDGVLSTNVFVAAAPKLRFVMGMPLRAHDGTVLGALIVADSQPRHAVLPRERSLLKDLAEQVRALLADLWTRNQARAKLASSQSDQLHDQLVDLLSQSYTTGLQMQQNELQMEHSSSVLLSSTVKPLDANDVRHMQSVEL